MAKALRDLRGALRRIDERRNTKRLWGAAGKGLLPPPPRAFGAFGARSMILPPSRVQAPECIHIGQDVQINEHVWLCVVPQPGRPAPKLVVGDRTTTNRFIKIVCAGEVVIGEQVGISDHVFITDTRFRSDDPHTPIQRQRAIMRASTIVFRTARSCWKPTLKPTARAAV